MDGTLRRTGAALSLAAALAMASIPAATAAPAPAYTATFTADASCLLTVKATWKNAPVARVYLLWYQDATWIATSDTESPVNSGTIKGKTATFRFGPASVSGTAHQWSAEAQFYTAAGAALEVADTAPVTVGCAVP